MTGKGKSQPFALTYDGGLNNPQQCYFDDGTTTCFCEDTSWYRVWSGSLTVSYVVDLPMCGQGGASIYTESKGDVALTIVAPSGASYAGHPVATRPVTQKRAIIVPRFGDSIERGIWHVIVDGVERRATLSVTIQMNYPEMQTAMAVEEDWQKENWPAWPHSGLSY